MSNVDFGPFDHQVQIWFCPRSRTLSKDLNYSVTSKAICYGRKTALILCETNK